MPNDDQLSASKPATDEQPALRPSTQHAKPADPFALPNGYRLMVVPRWVEVDMRRSAFALVDVPKVWPE